MHDDDERARDEENSDTQEANGSPERRLEEPLRHPSAKHEAKDTAGYPILRKHEAKRMEEEQRRGEGRCIDELYSTKDTDIHPRRNESGAV